VRRYNHEMRTTLPLALRAPAWLAALLAMFTVVACHKEKAPPTPSFRAALLLDRGAAVNPLRRAAVVGMERIRAELNAGVVVQVAAGGQEQRRRLRALASQQRNLVFCMLPGLDYMVAEEAAAYPDSWFVAIGGKAPQGNVAAMSFQLEDAGYLAGVIAAVISDGQAVGVLGGGGNSPFFDRAEDGFRSALESRAPKARVLSADGVDGVDELHSEGVVVALYPAERSDPAVLERCRTAGLRLVVADPAAAKQYPHVVLATLILDLPEAMVRVAQEAWAGTLEGKMYSFDLGSGVVDLRPTPGSQAATDARVVDALARARADVTAGIVEIEELGW